MLGGAAAAGRSPRARSRAIGCGASACSRACADDPDTQAHMAAFLQGLPAIRLDRGPQPADRHPLGAGDAERGRKYAAELVALAPDVILASGSSVLAPLLQATRTIPIVFTIVADPVGAGFVDSLAEPGGNVTGFTTSSTASAGNGWSCSSRSRRA